MLDITTGKLTGRYISNQPGKAASKCFTQFARRNQVTVDTIVHIYIRETTLNSKHKIYKYKCQRRRLNTPVRIRYPHSTTHVRYEYYTKVHRMALPDDIKKQYEIYEVTSNKSQSDIKMTYPVPIVVDDYIIEI
jgi:hypothetical protein